MKNIIFIFLACICFSCINDQDPQPNNRTASTDALYSFKFQGVEQHFVTYDYTITSDKKFVYYWDNQAPDTSDLIGGAYVYQLRNVHGGDSISCNFQSQSIVNVSANPSQIYFSVYTDRKLDSMIYTRKGINLNFISR